MKMREVLELKGHDKGKECEERCVQHFGVKKRVVEAVFCLPLSL